MVARWKLEAMADVIFQKFWNDREGVLTIANEMLDKCYDNEQDNEALERKHELEQKLKTWDRKYDNLLNMRMAVSKNSAVSGDNSRYIACPAARISSGVPTGFGLPFAKYTPLS